MRLADTVSPSVNAFPLKDRPSLITTAPWHHDQVLLLPLLLVFACYVPETFLNPATALSPLHCVMCLCFQHNPLRREGDEFKSYTQCFLQRQTEAQAKCFSLHTGVGCTNSWFGMTVQDHKMAIFWLLLSMLCVHIFY